MRACATWRCSVRGLRAELDSARVVPASPVPPSAAVAPRAGRRRTGRGRGGAAVGRSRAADVRADVRRARCPARRKPDAAAGVAAPRERRPGISFETLLAGRAMPIAGLLLVLLAAAFFLDQAFRNGWIGPLERIILGLVVGSVADLRVRAAHRRRVHVPRRRPDRLGRGDSLPVAVGGRREVPGAARVAARGVRRDDRGDGGVERAGDHAALAAARAHGHVRRLHHAGAARERPAGPRRARGISARAGRRDAVGERPVVVPFRRSADVRRAGVLRAGVRGRHAAPLGRRAVRDRRDAVLRGVRDRASRSARCATASRRTRASCCSRATPCSTSSRSRRCSTTSRPRSASSCSCSPRRCSPRRACRRCRAACRWCTRTSASRR